MIFYMLLIAMDLILATFNFSEGKTFMGWTLLIAAAILFVGKVI